MRRGLSGFCLPSARRGYLYVSVLLTTLAVSTMGLVALSTASLRLKSAQAANDWAAAQGLAQSAIAEAINRIDTSDSWRISLQGGVEQPSGGRALGRGSYTWKLVDDDGSLTDDDSDSVRVIGIGRVGEATVAESVRLIPSVSPLSCLESALHCQGSITLGLLIRIMTDQHVSSNGSVNASTFGASIAGDAEAVGSITGSVSGTSTTGVQTRRMPGSSTFDYYLDNGTWIPISSLPVVNGVATIEKTVLSPQQNIYGPSGNLEGIYVIDCQGARVRIQNCRIQGTIVLINPATNCSVEGSIRWDPAVANYPALLVAGSIQVSTQSADLSEAGLGVNFNPPGIPYAGNEDSDLSDAYPSEIRGLVYVSGNLNFPASLSESVIRGVTVCTTISANASSRFNYRPILLSNPPPGFCFGSEMQISPGSRRRESLP